MKKIKIIELFSGIGSQVRALSNIGFDPEVVATCEWDIYAFLGYYLFHHNDIDYTKIMNMNINKSKDKVIKLPLSINGKKLASKKQLSSYENFIINTIYESIMIDKNRIDVTKYDSITQDSDILTYSFPCQDLSTVGALHGFTKGIDKGSKSRSSLLWEVGRILKNTNIKKRPKYLIMENVRTLLSNRHFNNFTKWINELNKLGYTTNKYFLLDTRETGLPQKRFRLIMYSVLESKSTRNERMYIENLTKETIYNDYIKKFKKNKNVSVMKFIRDNYDNLKFLKEAKDCTPNDTPSRRKIYEKNPKININLDSIPTLTTKQDRHPNSGTIAFNRGEKGKSKFRYLTPRECLLLMGFKEEDYDKLIDFNDMCIGKKFFKRDIVYHMAGNSIPVNLLESVFYQIMKIENKEFE